METYKEMKARHQEIVNSLPMHFAFGQQQFNEQLKKLNCTTVDLEYLGMGGFCLKKDYDHIFNTLEELSAEEDEALKNMDFFYSALMYEFWNHEFGYTRDPEETLASLGLTLNEIIEGDEKRYQTFMKAVEDYLAKVDEA